MLTRWIHGHEQGNQSVEGITCDSKLGKEVIKVGFAELLGVVELIAGILLMYLLGYWDRLLLEKMIEPQGSC